MSGERMPVSLDIKRMRFAVFTAGLLVAITWLAWLLTELSGVDPAWLGVRPGEASGLTGVLLSPFLHGTLAHIFSNTLPLFILTALAVYSYKGLYFRIIPFIIIFEGLAIWFFAAPGTSHLGASGLIYGLASFLFFGGILRWEPAQLVIAGVVVFLYGSFIWGVLPIEPGVSWEGHLSGALAGGFLSIYYRKVKAWPHSAEPDIANGADIPEPEVFEQDIRNAINGSEDPALFKGGDWKLTGIRRE